MFKVIQTIWEKKECIVFKVIQTIWEKKECIVFKVMQAIWERKEVLHNSIIRERVDVFFCNVNIIMVVGLKIRAQAFGRFEMFTI